MINEKLPMEEVNQELRLLGFDPEEVRKKFDDLAEVLSQVRVKLDRLEEKCNLLIESIASILNSDAGSEDGNRAGSVGILKVNDGNAGNDDGNSPTGGY
ncbi:MAG: hypothetical protein P4L50_25525 [Anaerolineaceae bacterium]|nr:hypothetical protein [Anaerolineaceae bacterium]